MHKANTKHDKQKQTQERKTLDLLVLPKDLETLMPPIPAKVSLDKEHYKKKHNKSKKTEEGVTLDLLIETRMPKLPALPAPSPSLAAPYDTFPYKKKPYKLEVMSGPVVLTHQVVAKQDFTGTEFKNDRFAKRRGEPKMLQLFCVSCTGYIMSYQKDGPGQLLRCYLDRIHHPEQLKKLQDKEFDVKKAENLACVDCNEVVGVPMLYQFEKRPAFRMIPNKTHYTTLKL